jgi:hypothetical protein
MSNQWALKQFEDTIVRCVEIINSGAQPSDTECDFRFGTHIAERPLYAMIQRKTQHVPKLEWWGVAIVNDSPQDEPPYTMYRFETNLHTHNMFEDSYDISSLAPLPYCGRCEENEPLPWPQIYCKRCIEQQALILSKISRAVPQQTLAQDVLCIVKQYL